MAEDVPIYELTFTHTSFWVQIHNLPMRRMTDDSAKTIGATLGVMECVATSDDDRGGENCVRVRINMDITSPMCRGHKIKVEGGKVEWVYFQYERLPNFCYLYSYLDHGDRDCDIALSHCTNSPKPEQQNGAWLRASTNRPPRKTFIIVPGANRSLRSNHASMHPAKKITRRRLNSKATRLRMVAAWILCHLLQWSQWRWSNLQDIKIFPVFSNFNVAVFAEQLREIDQAINFSSAVTNPVETVSVQIGSPTDVNQEYMVNGTNDSTASKLTPSHTTNTPCVVFGDISNVTPTVQSKTSKKSSKWKKLTCPQGAPISSTFIPITLKPDSSCLHLESIQGAKKSPTVQEEMTSYGFENEAIVCNTIEILVAAHWLRLGPGPTGSQVV